MRRDARESADVMAAHTTFWSMRVLQDVTVGGDVIAGRRASCEVGAREGPRSRTHPQPHPRVLGTREAERDALALEARVRERKVACLPT